MMELYTTRWTIKVFFKEMKQHLRIGRCQSRDFDAQIAHLTVSCIVYIFLAYLRRVEVYESLGRLFEGMVAELREANVAERLWALFEELLQAVLSAVADSGPKVRGGVQGWISSNFNVRPNMPPSKTCLRGPSWDVKCKVSIRLPKSPKWNRKK